VRREAEARNISKSADGSSVHCRAERQRRVLDECETTPASDLPQAHHVGRKSIQVHCDDRRGARRDRRLDRGRIDAERRAVDVDEDDSGADVADR
jgi:hypothetical protein